MIDHSKYARILGNKIPGRARKEQSDMVIDATWWEDIQAQVAYMYTYSHDVGDERFKLNDLHPYNDPNKTPVDIKFIRNQTQTFAKNSVTFWLQFRPGQECVLDYYDAELGRKYNALWPVGSYIDIMAEDGKYNKWLVVDTADYWQGQFPTWHLLKVDYLLQWIHRGQKYQCPCVLQDQSSYNSGVWLDYKIQSVEDQQKAIVPMNPVTETIYYNHRMLLDTNLYGEDSECRAWHVSKVNRISPEGVCTITFAQDTYNQDSDYIEKDSDGNIIGKWANYFDTAVEPKEETPDDSLIITATARITYSGAANQVRVGGVKTFAVKFYEDDKEVDFIPGTWSFSIDGQEEVDSSVATFSYPAENKAKVSVKANDANIGRILTVRYVTDDKQIEASADVEIIAL